MDVRERLDSALRDRYRIERELGAGGMAFVYLAQDLKHHRQVAIKVLRPDVSAAMGPERFLREIEVAAGLTHPNILGLHDSGEADGLLYFVMPYVDGESLRDRLTREGRMDTGAVAEVAREVGSALDYAHSRGLIHRDVKPENILFQAGHALVCDFGIAKAASEAQGGLTRTGLAVGTLGYMSPEQMTGDGDLDGRTDVYALACMAFEMLTGEPPFTGANVQVLLGRKLMGELPDLAALRPDVPPTVREVVLQGMATLPSERPATPMAFADALEHATTEHALASYARRRRKVGLLRTAGWTAILIAVAVGGWRIRAVLTAPDMERIAVLPLTDRRGDPEQAFLAQGVHEDLILEMARAGLRVISANSVAAFGPDDATEDVARELRVDGVIRGTVEEEADSLTVVLALESASSLELVWTGEFRATERQVRRLYRDMTLAVSQGIGARLSPEAEARLAAAPEVDPQVYRALLQARFHWQQLTPEGIDTALEYYERALSLDSTSVEAWQGLSQIWALRAQQGFISGEEARIRGDSIQALAATINPGFRANPSADALRLTWLEWDWAPAGEAFERALDEDATDSFTRAYYAQYLMYVGRGDESEAQMTRAVETDPLNSLVQGVYGQWLNMRGEHEEAEASLTRALARDPEAPYLLSTMRTTYHLLGREEDAIESWRASYAASGDLEALAALDRGWERDGYSAALRSVAELMVSRLDTAGARPWQIATLYTRARMADEALEYLEQAYQEHDPNLPSLIVEPTFDFLRDDPRFQSILDRLAAPR